MLILAMVMAQAVTGLDAPMPTGFKVGYAAANGEQSIEERIPADETVQDWTRMVTIQWLRGLGRLGPHGFAERFTGLMAAACPGATVAPVTDAVEAGVALSTVRVDCPLNRTTGRPETMFGRIFLDGADIRMVQYAARTKPDAALIATANAYLASVRLRR